MDQESGRKKTERRGRADELGENPKDESESDDSEMDEQKKQIAEIYLWAKLNAPKNSTKTKETAERRLRQHVPHDFLTNFRVSRLEERLDALEKRAPSPEPVKQEELRFKARPELVFSWERKRRSYTSLLRPNKPLYAVHAILGEPTRYGTRDHEPEEVTVRDLERDTYDELCRGVNWHLNGLP